MTDRTPITAARRSLRDVSLRPFQYQLERNRFAFETRLVVEPDQYRSVELPTNWNRYDKFRLAWLAGVGFQQEGTLAFQNLSPLTCPLA
jgi:hypothetical protein